MAAEERIIYQGGTGEIVEKKSRFIATIAPAHTEEEATACLEAVRKRYWDARHHCYAYRLDVSRLTRMSDDGEPSGTAGRPILDVLSGQDLHDVVAVVTRYFGGTLLGTGGLVRAYTRAVRAGLQACVIAQRKEGEKLTVKVPYTDLGKIQHFCKQRDIPIRQSAYTEVVELSILVSRDERPNVEAEMMEATGAAVKVIHTEPCRFCEIEGDVVEL